MTSSRWSIDATCFTILEANGNAFDDDLSGQRKAAHIRHGRVSISKPIGVVFVCVHAVDVEIARYNLRGHDMSWGFLRTGYSILTPGSVHDVLSMELSVMQKM